MEGHCPEECITGPRNTRMEATNWEYGWMEVPREGDHGPQGALAPYMDGQKEVFKSKKSQNKTHI